MRAPSTNETALMFFVGVSTKEIHQTVNVLKQKKNKFILSSTSYAKSSSPAKFFSLERKFSVIMG